MDANAARRAKRRDASSSSSRCRLRSRTTSRTRPATHGMTSPRPERAMRVLIADDEPAARDKLRRLLAAHRDVEIAGSAASGTEAARAIRDLSPDVVLLDIRMPELDGFAVLEQIS